MNKFQLIKTDNSLILVSDEEIKEGDTCIALKVESLAEVDKIFQVEEITNEDSYVLKGTDGWRYSLSYARKVLSQSPKLSKEVADEIGIVNDNTEEWKPIKDFETKYLISNWGNLKGLSRNKERKLKTNQHGYYYVNIHSPQTGIKIKYIHQLVAEHFIGGKKDKDVVNHKDGNPKNNKASNLGWVSSSQNQYHAYDTGLRDSIIGTKEKEEIYNLRKTGLSYEKISKIYNVSLEHIRQSYFRYLKQLEYAKSLSQPQQWQVEAEEIDGVWIINKIVK